jgi:putative peptidoglycan lipid II flippase
LSVAKSSLLFSSGTFLSRIAGLIRDRVVLSVFGSSEAYAGFIIAFRIPNLLRDMLAEGALGGSFTKVYASIYTSDKAKARRLLFDMLVLMTALSVVVCTIGILLSPWLVELMTSDSPNRTSGLVATATGLTRLLFPFLGFMTIAAVLMGALHQRGQFFLTSMSPLLFNLFNIVGALWFTGLFVAYGPDWIEVVFADKAVTGFSVGVLIGGFAQMVTQFFGLTRDIIAELKEWKFRLPWSEDVKQVLVLMAPMVLAASSGQVNVVVNTIFATSVSDAAVVWLNSSFRLLQFPIGMFGVAIAVAVLPALARAMTEAGGKVNARSSAEVQNAIELVLWFMAPCFVFFLLNALPIVQCLYQSGRFNAEDSLQTANALFAYSFALFSYGLSKVLVSFYFALERTNYAFKVSLVSVVVNYVVNSIMVRNFGHVGLALGYSVTQGVSVVLLLVGLGRNHIAWNFQKLMRSLGVMAICIMIAAGVMALTNATVLARVDALSLPVFISSLGKIIVNGVLCVGLFIMAGMIYMRLTPRAALQLLKSRRRNR